jgi:membrane-bound lytic murein transglycosylase MltF
MLEDAASVAGGLALFFGALFKWWQRARAIADAIEDVTETEVTAPAPAPVPPAAPVVADTDDTKGEMMEATDRYNSLIQYYAESEKLDPLLLKALIRQESNFNPTAVSPVGARGLTQFMEPTARDYHVRDHSQLNNPETAIRLGAAHVAHLLRFWSNVPDPTQRVWFALASYNAGQGNIQKARNEWLKANAGGESYKTNKDWPNWAAVSFHLQTITGPINAHETTTYVARINHFWDLYAGRSSLADTGGAIADAIA